MKSVYLSSLFNRTCLHWMLLSVLFVLLCMVSLTYGEIRLSLKDLISVLQQQATPVHQLLVETIRLPRLVAGIVIGAALALSGLLLQLITRNPLASPDVFGISDSAVLAMSFTIFLTHNNVLGEWWHALTGAMICVCIILFAAGGVGTQGYRILVIGVGVATLMKASFDLVLSTLPIMHSSNVLIFSTGSLVGRGFSILIPAFIFILTLITVIFLWRRLFSVMVLPDTVIQSIGEPMSRLRLLMICIATLLAGTAVSIAGPVGFIAIAAPILTYKLFPRTVLPIFQVMLTGALMVIAADFTGRTLLSPVEIPAGIISGMIGGPLLLWLLFHHSRSMRSL